MQNCKEKYGKELRDERHKTINDGQKHKDSQGASERNRDMDSEGIRICYKLDTTHEMRK
jgi:hypothetical protein